MTQWWGKIGSAAAVASVLSGCLSPTYTDSKAPPKAEASPFGEVAFHVYDLYTSHPPECVAILPLALVPDPPEPDNVVTTAQAEQVRKAMYAHLSPQGKRDVELSRVDFILSSLSETERSNYSLLGEKLGCDTLLVGSLSEFASQFAGVYSRVAVGARLKMIQATSGQVLWEGNHVATSHGGSVPLSPIGIATGILDAAMNVEEEQSFRMVDDLARRLVLTIPDNRISVLEKPMAPLHMAPPPKTTAALTIDEFFARLTKMSETEQKTALFQAIRDETYHGKDLKRLHEFMIASFSTDAEANVLHAKYLVEEGDYFRASRYVDASLGLRGDNADMHFLKGRILIKLNDLPGADDSMLRAVALNSTKAEYYNGLGYLNSLRGNHERALAAYQMALDLEPANGYALYNMGVTFHNLDDVPAAREYLVKAARSYMDAKDYGQAAKALADLKEHAPAGDPAAAEIAALETSLANVPNQ